METPVENDLVSAAQGGDQRALDQLLRSYLPLVYNVVGRALNGDADVDDVVQETLIRAAQRLPSLRDTDRFRSWLIAISIRQVQTRGRVRARRISRESPLERYGDQIAPGPDFAETTVLELGLSGQRRQVVEATRWLSAEDRRLLALWWQEVAGVLTRSELVESAGLNRRHASVRIQRLKDRLDAARLVQQVVATEQGCPRLATLLREGGGRPDDRELNRLSRHIGRCHRCRVTRRTLVPPESLLAGIALLPVPDVLVHGLPALVSGIAGTAHPGTTSLLAAAAQSVVGHSAATAKSALTLKPVLATGAVVTGAATAITLGVHYLPPAHERPPAAPAPAVPGQAVTPTPDTGATKNPDQVARSTRYDAHAMVYFTDSPTGLGANSGLHLAVSSDGLDWMPLNQNAPVLTPRRGTGGLRDPSVLRRQDGTFVVLAADVDDDIFATTGYIHAWTSPDLRTFSYHRLRLHSRSTHTWGPEAFYDPVRDRYGIIYSASGDDRESIFVNYTTDFVEVGRPQLFFDPGFSVQDATVVREGTTYHLYYRDNRDARIHEARSSTLDPRSFDDGVQPGDGLLQGESVGGPTVVQENGGQRRWLWADSYVPADGELYLWQTTRASDPAAWKPSSKADYTQPLNARHGGIVPITTKERARLIARWGAPTWNRIKSYNYEDRLIRHQSLTARLDPYPFDPYPDAQWRLVPGLADRAGVSFRSVNMSGWYLRDTGDGVVLAEDDGSPGFREAATFVRVPGLADPGWTSFRSFTDPTRYLRHSQFVLRVDPISTRLQREDATFGVGY
ncbi:MAG: sigma-70 family RNA polymerase sigma factor [Actinomycetales bacterium]|nr:sigma-70 family RNA polymerase sigma factor [Actinomycetales bacterium]